MNRLENELKTSKEEVDRLRAELDTVRKNLIAKQNDSADFNKKYSESQANLRVATHDLEFEKSQKSELKEEKIELKERIKELEKSRMEALIELQTYKNFREIKYEITAKLPQNLKSNSPVKNQIPLKKVPIITNKKSNKDITKPIAAQKPRLLGSKSKSLSESKEVNQGQSKPQEAKKPRVLGSKSKSLGESKEVNQGQSKPQEAKKPRLVDNEDEWALKKAIEKAEQGKLEERKISKICIRKKEAATKANYERSKAVDANRKKISEEKINK